MESRNCDMVFLIFRRVVEYGSTLEPLLISRQGTVVSHLWSQSREVPNPSIECLSWIPPLISRILATACSNRVDWRSSA